MIDISAELSAIRNATYGYEIRHALETALQKIVDGTQDLSPGVELTLDEYNALPNEEKYSGEVYYVEDRNHIYKSGHRYGSSDNVGGKPHDVLKSVSYLVNQTCFTANATKEELT